MVYESGFTTRRSYTTRPVVTSYAVSIPTVERVSRVYKTSYPIYSSYTIPRRIVSGTTRVITSPVRVVTSPSRIISRVIHSPSPVRVVRTTTRVVSSPERTFSYNYSTPSSYLLPSSNLYTSTYTTPLSIYSKPSNYVYTPTSRFYTHSLSPVRITTSPLRITHSPVRIVTSPVRAHSPVKIITSPVRATSPYLKRIPPGYGDRALTNYLNTEPYETFKEETSRIRHRAQSLIRDLHTPIVSRGRSSTPFPVVGYEPTSDITLDAYVARITNPVRHVAKEVHRMSHYPEPARKYVGKSHLASVRICGDKAYNVRNPMYDTEKVRTDINIKSWYLKHPKGKSIKPIKEVDQPNLKPLQAVQVEA